ncbi:hypothetical protein BV898_16457 [Hypsibius exemplaris]|uniref:Uncharacterized protein n=1 Tax=Hypsibius exemplaris TaxID=2072580 RepID=A0A9X6NK97_HYPEX|nr:hypothetical protein BV898_16457 [Hypsibius exemplaris]
MCRHYINCVAAVDLSKRSKTEKNKFASSFSFELFRWALDVLMTRGNALPISDDEEPVIALVRFWIWSTTDRTPQSLVWRLEKTPSHLPVNYDHSSPFRQIFMSYLSLSVKERLINHGFTTPNEGVIQLQIDLNLSPDNPNRKIFEHLGSTFIQKSADSKLLSLPISPDGQPSIDSLKSSGWPFTVEKVRKHRMGATISLGIYFSHSEIMADPNNGQPISNTQTNSNHNAWPNPLMTSYQAPSAVAAMGQAQVVLGQGQVNAQQAGAVALASQAGVAQQGSINAQQSGQRAAQGFRDMAQAEAAQAAQMASLAQLQMATQAIGMAQAAAAAAQVTEARAERVRRRTSSNHVRRRVHRRVCRSAHSRLSVSHHRHPCHLRSRWLYTTAAAADRVVMGTDVPDPLDPVLEKFVYMSIVRAASDFLKRNASVASLAEEVCLSRDESQNLCVAALGDQILLERDRLTKLSPPPRLP